MRLNNLLLLSFSIICNYYYYFDIFDESLLESSLRLVISYPRENMCAATARYRNRHHRIARNPNRLVPNGSASESSETAGRKQSDLAYRRRRPCDDAHCTLKI